MACVRLTKLIDGELLAYLAGDADATTTAHLAACPECQQRATALATQEHRLTVRLYRRDCPPSLTLSEYELGLLSATESRTIAHHLRRCLHCAKELQILTNYLADVASTIDMAPTEGLFERARVLVARLVEELPTVDALGSLLTGQPSWAAAGVRGDAGAHLVYAVDDVQVILDVQADAQQPAYRVLLGLLLGLADPQQITAHLWRAEQPVAGGHIHATPHIDRWPVQTGNQGEEQAKAVATTTVDELGNFVITALTPGVYDLILSSDKTEVHIQTLLIA